MRKLAPVTTLFDAAPWRSRAEVVKPLMKTAQVFIRRAMVRALAMSCVHRFPAKPKTLAFARRTTSSASVATGPKVSRLKDRLTMA